MRRQRSRTSAGSLQGKGRGMNLPWGCSVLVVLAGRGFKGWGLYPGGSLSCGRCYSVNPLSAIFFGIKEQRHPGFHSPEPRLFVELLFPGRGIENYVTVFDFSEQRLTMAAPIPRPWYSGAIRRYHRVRPGMSRQRSPAQTRQGCLPSNVKTAAWLFSNALRWISGV